MATEILSVPEDHLLEVVAVLRAGLKATQHHSTVGKKTREQLTKWCDEEEAYMKELSHE